ncbi:MAG: chemotaxis protein CheW [Ignavibacteriaceae bacterium]
MGTIDKKRKIKIVLFSLDEPRYALHLSTVEQVVRAVEITPLPKTPRIVLGVINYYGIIIPVIDIRKRFNLPPRELDLNDLFIIAKTSKRSVVLIVDSVAGVHELDYNNVIYAEEAFPFADYLSGIAKIETNIVLINDLDKFLSLDEEKILDEALSGGTE